MLPRYFIFAIIISTTAGHSHEIGHAAESKLAQYCVERTNTSFPSICHAQPPRMTVDAVPVAVAPEHQFQSWFPQLLEKEYLPAHPR